MRKAELLANTSGAKKLLLALLILLCFLKFVYLPLSQWKADSLDRIAVLKRSVAEKEHLLNQSGELEAMLGESANVLERASSLFWQDIGDPEELMLKVQKLMERLAPENGVSIESVQWGAPSGDSVIRAPVTVSLAAPPGHLLAFMAAVESAEKLYTLDRLRFVCRDRSTKIKADITVTAYGVP